MAVLFGCQRSAVGFQLAVKIIFSEQAES